MASFDQCNQNFQAG